jgi:hypothetical protein
LLRVAADASALVSADLCHLLGHFRRLEAVGEGPAILPARRIEAGAPLAIDGVHDQSRRASGFEDVARPEARPAERRIGGVRQALQAAVDDVVADRAQQSFPAPHHAVGLVQPLAVALHGDALGQRGVEVDGRTVVVAWIDGACAGLRLGRFCAPVVEVAHDARLDRRHVEIPDDDESDMGGNVFALVEGAQRLGIGGVQGLGRADREALPVPCARIEEERCRHRVAQRPGVAVAHFRQHDAPLALQRFLRDREVARGLAHQHQRGVEKRGIGAGQVELVKRPVEPGRGVGIGAEGEPFALEKGNHLSFGHSGGAVEGHVLDKMREALLVVGLVKRSGLHVHAHHAGAGRCRVAPDDVAHAIAEPPETVRLVDRDVAVLESPARIVARGPLLRRQRSRPQRSRRQRQEHCSQVTSHQGQECPDDLLLARGAGRYPPLPPTPFR